MKINTTIQIELRSYMPVNKIVSFSMLKFQHMLKIIVCFIGKTKRPEVVDFHVWLLVRASIKRFCQCPLNQEQHIISRNNRITHKFPSITYSLWYQYILILNLGEYMLSLFTPYFELFINNIFAKFVGSKCISKNSLWS